MNRMEELAEKMAELVREAENEGFSFTCWNHPLSYGLHIEDTEGLVKEIAP
jgi:hypothetical protein